MWIKFKSGVTVNMDSVIKYEKTEFGRSLMFYCNGTGFKLTFINNSERDKAVTEIERAIMADKNLYEIQIEANTE